MKPDLTIIAGAPGADDAAGGADAMPAKTGPTPDLCVPLDALAEPDEEDQLQNPEPGDAITMQVEAKIVRVDGKMAYIQPTAVNGKPLDGSDADPDDDEEQDQQEDPDELGNLEQTANDMDAQQGGQEPEAGA